ncbi:MAG: DUF5685 family protein [Oscillospiraceae bacterium]
MFGYIRPFKPQMKIIEYDIYKSFYCGLCKEMGRKYGLFSRLTLSYDFSFLAMLGVAVNGNMPKTNSECCLFNPLSKKDCCTTCEELTFSADVAMIMFYYKTLDNISDESFFKRIFWKIVLPYAKSVRKKAVKSLPEIDSGIKKTMENQAELEKSACKSSDMAAEPTAISLQLIFAQLTDDISQKRVLEKLGYFLGKYVYLCDAFDDLDDDLKSKNYNPFILSHNLVNIETVKLNQIISEAKSSLYLTIGEAIKAYDLLEIKCYKPIFDNIFYLGLRSTVDTIEKKNLDLIKS